MTFEFKEVETLSPLISSWKFNNDQNKTHKDIRIVCQVKIRTKK